MHNPPRTDNINMDSKMTNNSIETESKETIEQILRFHECDESILVKMIIVMAGSQEGDNYMSVVKRLIVSGTHDRNQNGMQLQNWHEKHQISKPYPVEIPIKMKNIKNKWINRSRARVMKSPTTRFGR